MVEEDDDAVMLTMMQVVVVMVVSGNDARVHEDRRSLRHGQHTSVRASRGMTMTMTRR